MKVCPSCGQDNPDVARFCMACTTALAEPAPRQEERKVVTVLFADLVGFTSRSERMDVEDVRGTLVPYHQILRRELERYGGTVEKFIGDAVMALFGAPTAHEDDPERAVRAGLSIQDAVAGLREEDERLDLHVRIGVNTGEALVALGARPSQGEGMASGDVVNTAARLQSAAPVDGVLVGEMTYRATSRVIEYDEAESVDAKGKAHPVRVWVARHARSRLGSDVQQAPSTPLVGREREVDLLWAALDRARTEQSPQLVTLLGVPGMGKSRLVWELFRRVEDDPELVTWRQGRSLPYGEGVAFWALGEMVKAQAGVLNSDSAEVSGVKLHEAVAALIADERDAGWVEGHLRPLLGLETAPELSGDRQAEAFAAWRRFIEALAERGPATLVFEDLHWADDALLDFIDHLVEWASGVPLLIVGTARPELLERRKSFGAGTANALRTALSPLSEADTARLVAALLEQAVLPAQTQRALLERAEGNPLYAEEYVRMLVDRGVLVRDGEHWRFREGEDVPLPESVQGIIAARVDALPRDEKSALHAGSVIGKVFWLGAVEAIGALSRWQAEELLHRLERKEFVRRERQASVEGESEYAFRHILVRDVAYSQIPRAQRAEQHRRAAEWIESLAGVTDDRAEMLAHHYCTALRLLQAAGDVPVGLPDNARIALTKAGDHALALQLPTRAAHFYRSALDLASTAVDRATLRYWYASSLVASTGTGRDELLEAHQQLVAIERPDLAAEADLLLAELAYEALDSPSALSHWRRAVSLVAPLPPSRTKAAVLALSHQLGLSAFDRKEAAARAQEALEVAKQVGAVDLQARALCTLGLVRLIEGDTGGHEVVEKASRLVRSTDDLAEQLRIGIAAADMDRRSGRLRRSFQLHRELLDTAERFGYLGREAWLRSECAVDAYFDGDWDACEEAIERYFGEITPTGHHLMEVECRIPRGRIRLARGDPGGALDDAEVALAAARESTDPQDLLPALAFHGHAGGLASSTAAQASIDELLDRIRDGLVLWVTWTLPDLLLAVAASDRKDELSALLRRARPASLWVDAARASNEGAFGEASAIYKRIGSQPDEAYAHLQAASQLIDQGRRAEGEAELERSLAFWRRVRATAYVRECERLVRRVESA
jgi:class 3 adenylate cyclase